MSYKISTSNIMSALEELSERETYRYFLAADIAMKILSNYYGMKQIPSSEKAKASSRVSIIMSSIVNGQKHKVEVSDDKLTPMTKHYPGIQRSLGYRIGKIVPRNGNLLDASVIVPDVEEPEDTIQEGVILQDTMVDSNQDKYKHIVENMSYEECSELIFELTMRQSELYAETDKRIKQFSDQIKIIQSIKL